MSACADHLHTVFVTDGRGDVARLDALVRAALAGGIQCVQLREPGLGARALAGICADLRTVCRAHEALLFVNDRVDVALAGFADGVQLGGRSLPAAAVPDSIVRGASVHDAPAIAAAAAADFLLLARLFPTACKPGAPALGVDRARELVQQAPQPVVLLGGIDVHNAVTARQVGAAGIAVMSALCDAADPERIARELVATRHVDVA